MFTEQDRHLMGRALELAALGLFTATPNPRVGCVLVKEGRVVGEGWHRKAGEPHAEAIALASAGELAKGATAYVTLEPCAHTGRMPPCANALVQAGVIRVVAAMQDPNPLVSGKGFAMLRAAGVEVLCGLLEDAARELNLGFISRMTRGRPWVRMKIAASLDGVTALNNGESQWITGEAARHDGHLWRARACAILTGLGTVKQDDPTLNVRGVQTTRQPLRVVIDSRLEINRHARVLQQSPQAGETLIVAGLSPGQQASQEQGVLARELPVAWVPHHADGKTDLSAVMQLLGSRGINELHVEAGYKLNGSLLRAELVDELLLYLAPKLLGEGQGLASLGALHSLDHSYALSVTEMKQIGPDVRLLLRSNFRNASE